MSEWGQDDISRFLDRAHANQRANFVNFAPAVATLNRITGCFNRAGKNLINAKPVMAASLLLRTQYALKTAIGLALAGQVVEVFPMLRSVLEDAGYALIMAETPSLETVYLDRHQSEQGLKAQKDKFKVSAIRETLCRYDAKLDENFGVMYQRTIDFGGHPNPHALFSATVLDERDGETGIITLAMTADTKAISHALKSAAQCGLTALYIFQHIFKAKFELLGVRAEIDAIRNDGGL